MARPVCQNCHTEWSWKDTQKSMMQFKRGMICPHCGETQYQSRDSMMKTSMFGILPLFLGLPIVNIFNLSWLGTTLVILGVGFAYMSIIPFFMKLSNKDELLW
ncbi:TIGR04104 family putative zinc finger protein [Filobacillus milosensis]|nr:TIGR04104 family putative zinc finger protein [Filobacillus milosensis]